MNKKFTSNNLKVFIKYLPVLKANVYCNKKTLSITVQNKDLFKSLAVLKNHTNFQFKVLTCVSGVDYPNRKKRFKLVYELLSLRYNTRIKVNTFVEELTPVSSVTSVFKSAGWYESEIWDMFGVFFTDHPNLTKLLTDYGFEGYPLRKDFPLSGFVESSYDYTRKQVLNDKIELSQEFKTFQFESPWLS